MAKGGRVGGGPVVGNEGRNSARSGGFTAAGEHLPALRIRSLGRSLAPESRAGRCLSRPLCRRPGGGLRKPDGGGTFPERVPGTAPPGRAASISLAEESD